MPNKLETGAIRHMTVPFEIKATSEASGYAGEFSGYAAGILNIDRTGDMILPGAFAKTLPQFLKEGVVCWQHDWSTPIGSPVEASEDSYGLLTRSRISNTTAGRDCMTLIKDGVIKKMSIGYRVNDYEFVDRAGLLAWLGASNLSETKQASILQQYDSADLSELCMLKEVELFEYSPVSIPANPNAVITGAKGLPFAEHSEAVVTAIRELANRVKAIHALRTSQGKAANPAHVAQCCSMADTLDECCGMLRQMAEEMCMPEKSSEPAPKATNDEAKRLYAEFLKLEAGALRAA